MADAAPGFDAVLVPVKAFHQAKLRLAPALDPSRRVRPGPGDGDEAWSCRQPAYQWRWYVTTRRWRTGPPNSAPQSSGSQVVALNGAVQHGVAQLGVRDGARTVVVAAGDSTAGQ